MPNKLYTTLITQTPVRTCNLPKDKRGIYLLIDHLGQPRYIGSTSVPAENFYKRIHLRHRSGSETHSHYFSKVYNCGRMYRNRFDDTVRDDAKLAKQLRNRFISEHCRAAYVAIVGSKAEIESLEMEVIRLAALEYQLWNGQTNIVYDEPSELVQGSIDALGYGSSQRLAIERQAVRASRGQ